MLVTNPKKRRRSKRKSLRKNPMPLGLKAYWAGKRRGGTKRRRSIAARSNPIRAHRKRYRRNPISRKDLIKHSIESLKVGVVGAGSAIGVDFILSKLPLPNALKTGAARNFVRALSGIALATVADKFHIQGVNSRDIAMGPAVVAMHDQLSSMMALSGFEVNGFDFTNAAIPAPAKLTTRNGSIDNSMGMGYDYGVPGMGEFQEAYDY